MQAMMYKKRAGTSGINGQLYETKLISLVLFRLLHDDAVEEFCLASNVDDIGAFDDICFKAKIIGRDRPLFVFLQAKHKDDGNGFLDFDLIKYSYNSYMKVTQRICSAEGQKQDILFNSKLEDVECVFVLYTNAKWYADAYNDGLVRVSSSADPLLKQARRPYQTDNADKLNNLLATGDEVQKGFQADFTNKHLELLNDIILDEEITALAKHFTAFLNDTTNQSMYIMIDTYILTYHVILAQSVVHISEAVLSDEMKPGQKYRLLTFRRDFWNTEDKILSLFRSKLYVMMLQTEMKTNSKINSTARDKDQTDKVDEAVISSFLSEPSAISLSRLIGSHIIYKQEKFKFVEKRSNIDVETLERLNISPLMLYEAVRIKLSSLTLKVPETFGNIDLTIGGGPAKVEKRLNTLAEFIANLCKQSKYFDAIEIVTIDDSAGEGFLKLNGGIGSAAGSLLVYDKNTKLLKFTEDYASLKTNARTLFDKLSNKISDLDVFRFDVKVATFPKLVLDFTDKAKIILNKVVVYEKQSSQEGVEKILKQEIERHQRMKSPHNISINSDMVALHYHHEIQKWWMLQKTASYLTKTCDLFKQAMTAHSEHIPPKNKITFSVQKNCVRLEIKPK